MLYGILAATVCVSAGIVLKSVERKEGSVSARSEKAEMLRRQISSLERQEQLQLENIESIDASTYPTKRGQLLRNLEQGTKRELNKVRSKLSTLSVSAVNSGETMVMMWLRLLAIAWNIVLCHLLATRGKMKALDISK